MILDIFGKSSIISHVPDAGVAHPVERHLAKVEVASSSLVTRSIKEADACASASFYFALTGAKKKYKSPAEPCSAGRAPPSPYKVYPKGYFGNETVRGCANLPDNS